MKHDLHTLTGAYALGALEPAERRRFEAHLRGCDNCRSEVEGLAETVARLGSAAAEPPPERLRERVMDGVERTRQVPPRLTRPMPVPGRPATWLATAAAAACLALALLAGVAVQRATDERDRAHALNTEITAVLAAPDARTATARTSTGGSLTIIASPTLDKAVIAVSALPDLPSTRTYQLWHLTSAGPRPAPLLRPTGRDAIPVIDRGLNGARAFALTVEPSGGSPRPTTPPIAQLALPV
ncbi:anti-sigma factor [Thermomonospora umbrina]|uniref:Regulator of SigK n=1 Tax=Thermomonospora umbrina TaxID=111806 RepID=A0A3D9SGM4_9ACTN|nr:anti-sigma factor [Thermomonospora umbrina]REE95049.1 anti-sigma-K factor RskA [Thermomonospora umbrina]